MKTKNIKHVITCPFAFALWLLASALGLPAFAQGTSFTYQGRLNNNGAVANGSYDFQFSVADAVTGGNQIGSTLTTNAVTVSNGLFTLTLDFGDGVFTGADRWLFLSVKTNGAVSFTPLTPPQQITAAPYAVTAGNLSGGLSSASLSGTYTNAVALNNGANTFTGAFTGNGANVTNVNAATLAGLASGNFWQTTGNAGTTPGVNFLGTLDNQPVELRVNGQRAWRLEPTTDAPNVIGGLGGNYVTPGLFGATIGGGGFGNNTNTVEASVGTIAGGSANTVRAGGAFIGAGFGNLVDSNLFDSVISGGNGNTIQPGASYSTIAGGAGNVISNGAAFATIGSGKYNQAAVNEATVAGGAFNSALGFSATIGGGGGNTVWSGWATIAGGRANVLTNADYAVIGGGYANSNGGYAATVGGGYGNTNSATAATVAGGAFNSATYDFATMGGGYQNGALGYSATVGGGYQNTSSNSYSTVGGGQQNTASGTAATVPGGYLNLAGGDYSFAAGRQAKAYHQGSFVWADNSSSTDFASVADNQFLIRAGFVGINRATPISLNEFFGVRAPVTNTYGGMYIETAGTGMPFYGYAMNGGLPRAWTYLDGLDGNKWKVYNGGDWLTVTTNGNVGINQNNPGTALDVNGNVTATSFIGNGAALTSLNAANLTGPVPSASLTSVPVGSLTGTLADARLSGNVPRLNASQTFTGVNQFNNPVGIGGIAPLSTLHVNGTVRIQGANNWDVNNGEGDFRVGNDVQRFKIGVATGGGGAGDVWMRAQGGTARVFIKTPGGTTFYSNEGETAGVSLAANGTAWAVVSDRNVKKDFVAVDSAAILEKLAAMPITQWHYKWETPEVTPHIGPMAQDFKAAFYPGTDDKSITTQEADGVALAAIQGLNQKLETGSQKSEDRMQKLETENAELKQRLEKLEQLMNHKLNGGAQ